MIWTIIVVLAILTVIVCVPIQYRALNRIAFGRSMFISGMSILMGFIIALLPSVAATVVALALFIIGFGMLILMAVKSYQHMQARKHGNSQSSR